MITANGRSEDGQSIVEIDPTAVREFVAGLAGRSSAAQPAGGGSGSGAAPVAAPLLRASPGVTCVN